MNTIRAPVGNELSCKSWQTEALMRLLMNSVDPRVAEDGEQLIVYGGTGKPVRDHRSLQTILNSLTQLGDDETLIIQSGKPVSVFKTFPYFPRILSVNAMIVPDWAHSKVFTQLENKGLTMYGQATAASWAYIGVQGVLQATYETMGEAANRFFGGSLTGRLVLTSGLGGMGAAQPLSVTAHGGVVIVVEADERKIRRRLLHNYCDIKADSVEEALEMAEEAMRQRAPLSIALAGNSIDIYQKLLLKNVIPDIVTDMTAAHDLLNGYLPQGISLEQALFLRKNKPEEYRELAARSVVEHVKTMLRFQEAGSIVFDYGNNIRGQALHHGLKEAFQFPGFVSKFIRPLYCEGRGPCRWLALSGHAGDIYKIDEAIMRAFPDDERVIRWIRFVQEKLSFYGLPARTCWLNYEERKQVGEMINHMVRTGELQAPIAITRDHSEGSSMAAPYRETEGMPDASDAVADWPILNALLNAASGATMVSVQHGGGVGIGQSIHSGMTIVADGSTEALERLQRVLHVDPAMNIIRHAAAGYSKAKKMLNYL